LNNKKRPIFSKKGDKIVTHTSNSLHNFSKKSNVEEEEKMRHLTADINKKR